MSPNYELPCEPLCCALVYAGEGALIDTWMYFNMLCHQTLYQAAKLGDSVKVIDFTIFVRNTSQYRMLACHEHICTPSLSFELTFILLHDSGLAAHHDVCLEVLSRLS